MNPIRWGIAGPGIIANKFAKAVKNCPDAVISAVASRSIESAKAFAEKYDIPNAFEGYEKMAASKEIDAVYISTVHPYHTSCAEIFLKAGKHVLCEKPLCINAYQAKKLKKCAKENGVFLMEGMWTRFLPAVIELQRLIKEGAIGEIRGLTADFCYASTPKEEAKLFDNSLAGGSLLDVGVYCLHFASMVMGNNIKNIKSTANVKDGADLHTSVLLEYESGAISSLSSAITVYKPEDAYIYGSKGYIYVPHFYGANEFFVRCEGETKVHIVQPSIGDGFEEEIIEACNCIREGKTESDILPLSKTIEIIKQMDAVREQLGITYPFEGEMPLRSTAK